MSKAIHREEEFSVAMQQLSAEAEKTLPMSPIIVDPLLADEKINVIERMQAKPQA